MKKAKSHIIRYTAESRIRHPILLLKEMWRDLKGSWELAWRLTVRDISALYRQTVLGYILGGIPAAGHQLCVDINESRQSDERRGIARPLPGICHDGYGFFPTICRCP